MKKSLLINLILGVIMLTTLLSAFGIGNKEDMPKMYPRKIDISGNLFAFMIPENFSRDMPAEDLIEHLNLESSPSLQNEGFVTLMRRWWDTREPGFFGKEQGTIMMSITVRNRPKNQAGVIEAEKYDFHYLHHFLISLYDSLLQRYERHNKEVSASHDNKFIDEFTIYVPGLVSRLGDTTYSSYEMVQINHRQWATTDTVQGKQVNKIYALPLNEEQFLEIEFTVMPNDNIAPYDYIEIAKPRINAIAETFMMHYTVDNEFDKVTSINWENKTFIGEMENKKLLHFDEPRVEQLDGDGS